MTRNYRLLEYPNRTRWYSVIGEYLTATIWLPLPVWFLLAVSMFAVGMQVMAHYEARNDVIVHSEVVDHG